MTLSQTRSRILSTHVRMQCCRPLSPSVISTTTITVLYHPPPGELGATVIATIIIAPGASRSKAKDINCAISNECGVGAISLARVRGVPFLATCGANCRVQFGGRSPRVVFTVTIIEFFRLFDSFFRVVDKKQLGLTRRNTPKD